MRVGFLSPWRADDADAWSGIVRPMFGALSTRCDVAPLRVELERDHPVDRAAARICGTLRRGYLPERAVMTSRSRASAVEEVVHDAGVDVVLSVAASTQLAFADVSVPTVEVSDATFALVTGYYPMFSRLHVASRWQGELLGRRTAARASGFLVASEWAARSLREDYRVDPARIRSAPFGPSVVSSCPPAGPRPGTPLRILFVARDWTRKGGDLALATVERLRDEGVSCDLTVVGDGPDLPAWVHRTGRLGREEVGPLYAAHDVLLETARANAGGVTLTDAAASGLPVVATRTGGVPSIVEDGVTGILVDPSRVVPEAVRAVSWLADPHHWSQFSDAALRRSRDELSWSRWAETAVDLCANVVDRH